MSALVSLVRGLSPVAGEGVFAAEPIARGTAVVSVTEGRRVHRSEYQRIDWPNYRGRIMQVDDDWFLEGIGAIEDFINHGCDPNLGFDAAGTALVALRSIAVGEELLFHYSSCENHENWRVPCGCGAVQCRGAVVGFRDLPPDERRRLLPICLPYLRRLATAADISSSSPMA
ncbi:MAG: SET domain-containing protein-lysine N-methyltransferase [Azospirillum sp.]|nr:SET domain-containing protein-lysine N-methyltransferase [Azospirillum sp.]